MANASTSHFRFFAIVCGLLFCAASSFRLWQLSTQPLGDQWTPAVYATDLETTTDKFEVLVSGMSLAKAADGGKLMMATEQGSFPLKSSDIKVRLNNAPAVRAASVPAMLGFAALAGGSLVLFLIGLFTPMIGAFHPHGPIELHLTS
ncbi:MAG: hypothetical protein IT186_09110 [Acidobacteria bacterium]|nr:hypothetical protein [Acidobacteriota bacterium]MCK6681619.1 hypothetical protein [Thermoanaerobaculia bacterium]